MWELGCLIVVEGLIFALSVVSHGLHETIRFFSNTLSAVKRYAHIDSYNAIIIQREKHLSYRYLGVAIFVYFIDGLKTCFIRFRNIFISVRSTQLLSRVLALRFP